MEIPTGRGASIAKIYKGKYEAYLEIPGGGRVQMNDFPSGIYGSFMEPHILF